ncbi:3-phosphoshikimate 1-carboxyvinyltransferase [Devosia sp. Root635]|uniref:3-phosphoshikimate 1-carboxyvinyltransferase n=1 Tax=Devosia sp. Root635 TaxID=1736575 RepID=UPI0009E9A92E|nr:3-phosphoshikimate 1-carboxyvinyltransferase [Devosia sp. Root635]
MNEIAQQIPAQTAPLASHGAHPLSGRFVTPGDRAISHRSLILGALAVGQTSIEGLLEAEEVLATAAVLRQLGVRIEQRDGAWHVHGLGVGGLLAPEGPLELGNSGAGAQLLVGLLAPYPFASPFVGGATLTRRTMEPLLVALAQIGATVREAEDGGLTLHGPLMPLPLRHVMAAPSEPIKSALLLAAAQIAGTTTIIEPVATGDHTETMLADFGAAVTVVNDEAGGATISITGIAPLQPRRVVVPGDPTSAAYPLVAALIVPGSELVIENVLVNPNRTGLIDTLLEMGGDIAFLNQHEAGGEHIADLRVRSSRLRGIGISAAHAAGMLDDIPTLAVAAAHAQGETTIEGLGALRHQECDRLAAIAAGLAASKVTVNEGENSLTIGGIGKVEGGGMVASRGDHRIAMSFLMLGLASQKPVTVDDTGAIAAHFPGFVSAMTAAGARFEPVKGRQK